MKIKWNWVPNTLTLGNLTLGFVSMLVASEVLKSDPNCHESFALAGLLIIIAAIFDGFDGMAARALNATSEIGADLDSLADLTTFGIAPGFLAYKMFFEEIRILSDVFPLGMFLAALYPACAAYRLARFNVAHDPNFFVGLPSPVAGVVVGFYPLVLHYNQISVWFALAFFSLTAFLMVSVVRYSKPQVAMRGKFNRKKGIFLAFAVLLILVLLGVQRWPWFLYGIVFFYIFSGIVALVIQTIQSLGEE